MSYKVFIYNRITGKPQNLMLDIYRWETIFSVSTTYLKIDLGPPVALIIDYLIS